MKKPKYYVCLDEQEVRIMLKSLIIFKNALIQQGRYTDMIDELILKVVVAPVQKA